MIAVSMMLRCSDEFRTTRKHQFLHRPTKSVTWFVSQRDHLQCLTALAACRTSFCSTSVVVLFFGSQLAWCVHYTLAANDPKQQIKGEKFESEMWLLPSSFAPLSALCAHAQPAFEASTRYM